MDKREVILKHLSTPYRRVSNNDESYLKANSRNASCIDNIDVYVKINDNVIEDITFEGEACAISVSSTSIMIKNLIGKSIEEAKEYIRNFEAMLEGKLYDEAILNEGIVYADTKDTARSICAILPYEGIKKILNDL